MPFKPVQLPSGRWQGGFRHPVTRRKVTRTFDYPYEAEGWAATAEADAANPNGAPGAHPADGTNPAALSHVGQGQGPTVSTVETVWIGPRLSDVVDEYLSRRAGILARNTRDKYAAWAAGLHIGYGAGKDAVGALADRHIGTLTRPTLERWMSQQKTAGVGAPTINGRLRLVRMIYADLLAVGEVPIQRDPTHGLKFLTEDIGDDYILTRDDEARLLGAARAHPVGAALRLDAAILAGLDAGPRWQEVFGLRVRSVMSGSDGPASYLSITHVVEKGSRKLRAYPKGKRGRVVPTTERLAQALQIACEAALARSGGDMDALLFPALSARPGDPVDPYRPWDPSNFRQRVWLPVLESFDAAEKVSVPSGRVRKYATDAGPAGSPIMQTRYTNARYGPHALRHTYGSRLADAGVPRVRIAALMGHADEKTTGRYIHAGDDGANLALVRQALTGRQGPELLA